MWWRRRRQRTDHPGTQAYGAWRPYADTVEDSETVVERKENGQVYEVSWVKTEVAALEYLRRRDVRHEGYYVIVETPYRNFGRDMVMIFDEAGGMPIEVPERTPLPELTASPTHCARCGYPVLPCVHFEFPCDGEDCGHPWHTADFSQTADEVIRAGFGYRCTKCRSAACRSCYEATGSENLATRQGFLLEPGHERPRPVDQIVLRLCWICQAPVTVFDE